MKASRFLFSLAALFFAASSLKADILVLKNGEKKEGNILEERPDAVRMHYKITPKIWDDKDFPRADIAQIIKQKPEEIEIVDLRKTLPTPDLLPADGYEQIIQDRLRPFINKYPGTPQAQEVQAIIDELQKEKDKVVAGQAKVEGVWLSAEMVKRDDYNIQAYKIRRSINDKAAAGNYVGALRDFDLLRDPVRGYPAAIQYAAAVPEVIAIMEIYEKQLLRMITEQPMFMKQRENGLKGKVAPELTYLQRAIDKEVTEWKATYDSEKKSRIRWLTPYKYDIKTLQELYKVLVDEKNKLKLLDMPGLVARNEALTKAFRYVADGNVLEAENALKAAQLTIKTGQSLVMQDASRIISTLRSRLTTLKSDQAKNKAVNRSFGAGSSAVGGGSAAITDDRVKKAMDDADARKAGGAAPAGKKEGEDKPSTANPSVDKPAPEKPEGEKPAAEPKTSKSKKKAAPPSDEPAAIRPPVEEESNTQTYLLIAGAVLVVVLLVAFLMQKKKAK